MCKADCVAIAEEAPNIDNVRPHNSSKLKLNNGHKAVGFVSLLGDVGNFGGGR